MADDQDKGSAKVDAKTLKARVEGELEKSRRESFTKRLKDEIVKYNEAKAIADKLMEGIETMMRDFDDGR